MRIAGLMASLVGAISGCTAFPQSSVSNPATVADWPLPRAATPESVGLSSSQLERLAEVTRAHVATGVVPGAVLLVARQGKLAYLQSFGSRDRGAAAATAAMRDDSIFRIYSMTKPIVSVALMMLVEEGRLQVNEPITRFIPELGTMKLGVERKDATGKVTMELVDPPRAMTVQDLLRHTSGLTYGGRASGPVAEAIRAANIGDRNDSNQELVSKIARTPLLYAPGTQWEYGVSTDVIGRLVEVISGKTLGEFLEERILRPLGMKDTAFWVPPEKLSRAAQPFQRPGGPPMTLRFDIATKARYESGGGGLTSTAADYLRFTTMLLNGGEFNGQRIIGRKTLEFMTADHVGKLPGRPPGLGFGLGFEVRKEVGMAAIAGSQGEYGWAGNAGTLFWIDPKEQLIAIYMVQVNDGERIALRNQFRSMVQSSIIR